MKLPLDLLAVATVAALLATPAEASLFAVDSDRDQLLRLSTLDGSATVVGSTALNGLGTPAGLAWTGTTMYTIDLDGGELFSLDLSDGTPTLVASTGLNGWQGLASNPAEGGQLYGANQNDNLYRIGLDGALTLIGAFGPLITALEFDAGGVLWGIDFNSGNLGTISLLDGSFDIVSTTVTGFQGLSFAPDGTLYAHNTNTDGLFTVDPLTGNANLLGTNGTVFVKGLAFDGSSIAEAPEPASTALLAAGLLAAAGSRRRRRA